jgi:hypothetical protein
MSILTRIMTLIAITALAAAVLFRFSPGNRMPVCIVVCVATILLAVRSVLNGKFVWALLFLGLLGVFTPFRSNQFSQVIVSLFDLATLALFAVSPLLLRKSVIPIGSNGPHERL